MTNQPALLAHHCTEGGLNDRAVDYWLKAGQQAIARYAMPEAVAQLQKGLDLLPSIPDGVARKERELSLQIAIGHALIATKGEAAPEPGEAFARARHLCQQLIRPVQLAPILVGQFTSRLVRGELKQAEQHANEIRELGEVLKQVRWKCAGSACSGDVCFWLGKFNQARVHLENALSFWDPKFRAQTWGVPQDLGVLILVYLSRTLLYLGYIEQARLRRDEALGEARRDGLLPYALVFALSQSFILDKYQGVKSAKVMLREADELMDISREHGFPQWFCVGRIQRGWCLGAMSQQPAEGLPLLLEGIEFWRSAGCNLALPAFFTLLAEVYEMAGEPRDGLNRLDEAAKLVETTHERWNEAEMHRLRGTLLLSMHKQATAEESYRLALAVARRQSAKFWELRAALDLARLLRNQGKRTEARDLLAPVYGWFTEGFDTPVLQDAKALLDQLV